MLVVLIVMNIINLSRVRLEDMEHDMVELRADLQREQSVSHVTSHVDHMT